MTYIQMTALTMMTGSFPQYQALVIPKNVA